MNKEKHLLVTCEQVNLINPVMFVVKPNEDGTLIGAVGICQGTCSRCPQASKEGGRKATLTNDFTFYVESPYGVISPSTG